MSKIYCQEYCSIAQMHWPGLAWPGWLVQFQYLHLNQENGLLFFTYFFPFPVFVFFHVAFSQRNNKPKLKNFFSIWALARLSILYFCSIFYYPSYFTFFWEREKNAPEKLKYKSIREVYTSLGKLSTTINTTFFYYFFSRIFLALLN